VSPKYIKLMLALLLVLQATPANAEMEKIAIPFDNQIRLFNWPKVVVPNAWHHEKESSYANGVNIIVQDNFTFGNSESVIYTASVYKPSRPEIKSLEALIAEDKKALLTQFPETVISTEAALSDGKNNKMLSLRYSPRASGNWERVTYGEETDFYLIFTLSSRSEKGYLTAMPTYKKVIKSYNK
jgi:hypothetical protein